MHIEIQNNRGEWKLTGWESSTRLDEVLDDERNAVAARRVSATGEVLEVRRASHQRCEQLMPR